MDYPQIPGYVIQKRLGEGGMATVYLALQEKFNRLVALKIMSAHLASDPSFSERFLREAHIVAQMSHRNFVSVFDVGQHGDLHYMTMEYLPKGDLKDLMARGLPLHEGLRIAKEIASGLHYASSKNFVHRDIKPDNILFREDHSSVIGDFGIARSMDSDTQMTVLGTVIGTAYYMSPEQAKAEVTDGRSDLYNLGVIIYKMLTGQMPYEADSATAISIKHASDPIPLLPSPLEVFQPFIDQALAKHPNDRFQNGEEMIDAIEELEEREYELIDSLSTTPLEGAAEAGKVPRDEEDLTRIQSFGARRTGEFTGSAGRTGTGSSRRRTRGRRRKGSAASKKSGSGIKWAAFLVLVVAGGAGAAYWMKKQPDNVISSYLKTLQVVGSSEPAVDSSEPVASISEPAVDSSAPVAVRSEPIVDSSAPVVDSSERVVGSSEKSQELNQQAIAALEAGHLFLPEGDNAQYFFTTLLALYPEDEAALQGIDKLYRVYLDDVSAAIESGDFDAAEETLNHASQISYYIRNTDYVDEQGELRNQLIVAQQESIIAKERTSGIAVLLTEAETLVESGQFTTPPEANAYDKYQQVLARDPENAAATDGLETIAGHFLQLAREQAATEEFTRARASMAAAAQIFPHHPEIETIRDEVLQREQSLADNGAEGAAGELRDSKTSAEEEIDELLAAAEVDIAEYRLTAPADDNALDKYNRVLALDPASTAAVEGLENVAVRYIHMAETATTDARLDEAERYLEQARKLSPTLPRGIRAQEALNKARESTAGGVAAADEVASQIEALWLEIEEDVAEGRLYAPANDHAMLKVRKILELDPDNEAARDKSNKLMLSIAESAATNIDEGELEQAREVLDYLAANGFEQRSLDKLSDALNRAEVDVLVSAELVREQSAPNEPEQPVPNEPEQPAALPAEQGSSQTIENLYD